MTKNLVRRCAPKAVVTAFAWLCAAPTFAEAQLSTHRHHELSPTTREQLAMTERFAASVQTPEAARKWGYRRIAPRSISDLNHLTGEHWINERYLRTDSLDPMRPAYLMFYPIDGSNDTLRLVGVAYGMAQLSGAKAPEGFASDLDDWHVHHSCRDVPGMKSILADGAQDCRSLGGRPGSVQIAMVHVWLDPPNPAGTFAPDNPALPFVAVGLTPPTASVLADPTSARRVRKLSLALGEIFGAVPRLGGLINSPRNPTFAAGIEEYRSGIRALLPALQAAETAGDSARYAVAADSAIAQWENIRDAYLNAADSDALRTLIERWFDRSTTGKHHTH